MCLWSGGFLKLLWGFSNWSKTKSIFEAFLSLFFEYSSLYLIFMCSFQFRVSKKQQLFIIFQFSHASLSLILTKKTWKSVVQTQVTMPFGPLHCNHNALNTSQMAVLIYIYRTRKYTFFEYDHWNNYWIKWVNFFLES